MQRLLHQNHPDAAHLIGDFSRLVITQFGNGVFISLGENTFILHIRDHSDFT